MKHADPRATTRRRMALCGLLLLVGFAGLAARAAQLAVLDERGLRHGKRQAETVLALAPERGAILDRGGNTLALSVAAPSIYAVPAEIADPAATARALAPLLGRSARTLEARLSGRRGFAFIARWVDAATAQRVRALDLRGIGSIDEPRRMYPSDGLAGHLVGFANIDGVGVRGLEQLEDDWLRGVPLRLPVERDGSGHLLVDLGDEHWSTAGGDVALTLDAAMQADALLALRDAVETTGARGGIVISMDPTTGDVLALAELPEFDPNRFRELSYDRTRSRAFLDAMEPGSTLKAFLVAAALEHGSLRPDDLFDCENGSFPVPGKVIRDHHPYGVLRSADVLRVSSNIGAVKIAFALGPHAHAEMLRRFGFGESTQSGFPEESAGLLREPRVSRPVDHATLAFGQGLSVTPIQLAAATAALANGGEWMRPRLVAARRAAGGPWQATEPEAVRRVVSPATAATLLEMLETVVQPDGTGRRAALENVRVAGKTGTAQKFDFAEGRYSDERFIAWFIGVAPADAPRLALVVALDEPRRPLHTGGAAAAPVFARVAAAQLARLGILTQPLRTQPIAPEPPETVTAAAEPELPHVSAPAAAVAVAATPPRVVPELMRLGDRVLLPDLRGLTVDEVRAVTGAARIAVEISGRGRAVEQDPPPGSVIAASRSRLEVRFEPDGDPI